MLTHDYIANDFNVYEQATAEFLEQAAKELDHDSLIALLQLSHDDTERAKKILSAG